MKRNVLPILFALVLLFPIGCATADNDDDMMTVAEFLRMPNTASNEMITIRGPVIESLNSRTFAMGDGNDVILVIAPADNAALGTRADAGDTVVVTGTAEMIRRGDPAMPFVDETIKEQFLNRPGIIASNVQVVNTGM